ncbi:zinc-dependent alcohol dehydrogenase [Homoserinimonas sp. A520]
MRAVVKTAPVDGALELVELDRPVPKPGEALLAVTATGICGTDVAIWRWKEAVVGQYGARFPLVPGHEMGGRVVESTSGAFSVGTVVGVNPQISCRVCQFCAEGRPTLCVDRVFLGGGVDGGWAEYVCVPETNLYALPDGVDADVATLMEPLAVAAHAVLERAKPEPGDTVVVIGAGPIGLATLILALDAGAGEVFVTGIGADTARLALAAELGGIPINVDEQDPLAVVRNSQADGADIVYETSGSPLVFGQALSLSRRGGRIALIGLASVPSEAVMTPIVLRELTVLGSRGYNETTWNRLQRVLPRVQQRALMLVSHRMPLSEFGTALDMLAGGHGANKILLVP